MSRESFGVIHEGFGPADKPQKYQPTPPLKELILRDNNPVNEVYRDLIKAWPDINDFQLKNIITSVDKERIRKVLHLAEKMGRSVENLNEFLEPEYNHKIFDSLYRYYVHVLPKVEPILEKINEELGVDHKFHIDGKIYTGRIFFFIDGEQKKLDLYTNKFGKPVIGSPYTDWPCFSKIQNTLNQLKEEVFQSLEKIHTLSELFERYLSLRDSVFIIDPKSLISFPVKYVKRYGTLSKKLLYANTFTLPCAFCKQGNHDLVLIALLEAKK